ncbi:NAD(P)-dependent alcohol dehydrogenase [uncultured Maritalea sp.]|jgi:NADPH:quinone reductase-like Zn-dependent oxidoreductase|uniref:NAD(P)-dependent alcohol dehydrogenase n=1 Tax=uncultured Maritalea sp. TaxID=757249 RepID=UPI00260ED2E6|nr:NAD(P)-dependent alcohol dehydrogenase [uncultured Maritalea sp.]
MSDTMQAITSRAYGGPEVMRLEQVERPVPSDDQVLIKVAASSVNPYDWHFLRGSPFFIRLAASGLFKPKNVVLGADVAGVVAGVGRNVKKLKVGDEVFGDIGAAAFAQYAVAKPEKLALKPKEVSFLDAGVVGIAGLTALQAVRDWGEVKAGQKVLVNGASGGVGTYAVQIAKALGAEVTGVCSTPNVALVKSLGADHVIDYKKEDFTQNGVAYDVIIDLAANRSISDTKRAMAPVSKWVLVGFNLKNMLMGGLFGRWLFSEMGKAFVLKVAEVTSEDLETLGAMLASGEIRSVIDRAYPLKDTPIAIEYIETMRAKGKVAIEIE